MLFLYCGCNRKSTVFELRVLTHCGCQLLYIEITKEGCRKSGEMNFDTDLEADADSAD